MSFVQKARFLYWYASTDLWAKAARWTTIGHFLTVACLIAMSAIVQGLLGGYAQQQLKEYEAQPPYLWIEQPAYGQRITNDDLIPLPEKLQAELPQPDDYLATSPFRALKWSFIKVDMEPQMTGSEVPVDGRTLDPQDRMLIGSLCEIPPGDSENESSGVWITRSLWKRLNGEMVDPSTIRSLRYPVGIGQEVEVPILGIIEKSIPLGYDFIVTEAGYQKTRITFQLSGTVDTGPLPPEWNGALPPDVKAYLATNMIKYEPQKFVDEEFNETYYCRLSYHRDAESKQLTLQRWQDKLHDLEQRMIDAKMPPAPNMIAKAKLYQPRDAGPRELPGYDIAGVYFRSLDQIEPALDALERVPYRVLNRDFVMNISATKGLMNILQYILHGITIFVMVIAVANITLLQKLRSEAKITETGMLKAMGVDRRLLRDVYTMEAVILWACSLAVAGLIVGVAILGLWMLRFLPLTNTGFALAWTPRYWASLIMASFAICLVTAWVATGKARKRSPMDSLRYD